MTNKSSKDMTAEEINNAIWEIQKIPKGHYTPDYTGNISDAWELVDEIAKSGYFVKVSSPQNAEHWPLWSVKIDLMGYGDNNPPSPGGWWFGENAPIAIGRAYIKWKQEIEA